MRFTSTTDSIPSGDVQIIRPLVASEVDEEVGPMFLVHNAATGQTHGAFVDELDLS